MQNDYSYYTNSPKTNVISVSHTLFQKATFCQSCFFDMYQDFSRGNGPFMSPLPTKLLMNWEDITTDHRDVPANFHGDETMFEFCLLVFYVEQAVCFSSSASFPFLQFPK